MCKRVSRARDGNTSRDSCIYPWCVATRPIDYANHPEGDTRWRVAPETLLRVAFGFGSAWCRARCGAVSREWRDVRRSGAQLTREKRKKKKKKKKECVGQTETRACSTGPLSSKPLYFKKAMPKKRKEQLSGWSRRREARMREVSEGENRRVSACARARRARQGGDGGARVALGVRASLVACGDRRRHGVGSGLCAARAPRRALPRAPRASGSGTTTAL